MPARLRRSFRTRPIATLVLTLALSACGGGGGSGGGTSTPPPVANPPPVVPPPVSTATLDLVNTGKFGGVALQALALTRDLTETLRPGVNPGIPTGSQNGNCPLGGSLRTQLSNDRLRLTETFNNCDSDVGAVPTTINGVQQTV